MLDTDRVQALGDFLALFHGTGGRGKKQGGSKKAGKRAKVKSKSVAKKSGGKKTKTIKARKSGGQKAVRRTQKKVSRSRSKKK